MKLPNCLTRAKWGLPSIAAVTILLVGCLERVPQTRANYHQESVATNEIPTSPKSYQAAGGRANFSQFPRDVTDLRLSSDLRSIKLRWAYKHSDENRPESFRIRYCELTSWMAEIKCRHKAMPVRGLQTDSDELAASRQERPASLVNDPKSTVITLASVQAVAPQLFEAQIFDLRALTNYTFHVQVARFVGEPLNQSVPNAGARQRPSRRLDQARDTEAPNQVSADTVKLAQIETTKPFSAEAVKCLANSSEVLINTGRFFGGRISVEGQLDGRCQLVGNKSSEQAIYSFHIDHRVCRSKVMDANRIETMILVHENKDILTHNTARFLVQCNIGQESFTVKASISLPKVINSLGGGGGAAADSIPHTRPAMITPLGSKPSRSSLEEQGFNRVHLGSMPGVYRLIHADSPAAPAQALTNSAVSTTSNYLDGAQMSGASGDALQTATTIARAETSAGSSASRQSAARSLRHSVGLTAGELLLPKPVDVSSRVLFVERAREAAAVSMPIARQLDPRLMSAGQSADLRWHQSGIDHSNESREQKQAAIGRENSSKLASSRGLAASREQDEAGEPVIMTNNHRVAGDFISLGQHLSSDASQRARADNQQDGASEFSIKYSANKVDGYSLNKLKPVDELPEMSAQTSQTPRSRSGRMRQMGASTEPLAPTSTVSSSVADEAGTGRSPASIESRMGDVAQEARVDARATEPSEQSSERPARVESSQTGANLTGTELVPQTTLAHNITGAIIRWSLKTLGNLARKSLESLAADEHEPGLEARQTGRPEASQPSIGSALAHRIAFSPPTTTRSAARSSFRPTQRAATKVTETATQLATLSEGADTLAKVDGFVVNSRPPEQTSSRPPADKSSATQSSRQQTARAQTDAIRESSGVQNKHASDSQQARANLEQRTAAVRAPIKQSKAAEVRTSEQEVGESELYSKEGSRSQWLLFGLWILGGLVSLIMAAVYFVLMSPKHQSPFVSDTINSLRHHNRARRKASANLGVQHKGASLQHSPVSVVSCATNSSKVQASSKNFSSFSPHLGKHVMENPGQLMDRTLASSSSPSGSAATRSTSAASSALRSSNGRENYCRDQEQYVVYTDYLVLTDDNSSLADDHECLTRSSRRRRHPSESFA